MPDDFYNTITKPSIAEFKDRGSRFIAYAFPVANISDFKKRLQELKTHEDKWTVYVKPSIVAEVTYNEVQKSPRYKSGFALRFARITSFREDKPPEDADTIQRLRQLYEKQFEQKSRLEST